ncbi:hypothetical protein ACFLYA_00365 [Candidatus Dependentiae bacterium]
MKFQKFFLMFFLFCLLNVQAKIYFDDQGKKVVSEDSVLDVCIFLDEWDDLRQTYENKRFGAVLRELEMAISQGEAVIASGILIDSLISISKNQAKKSGGKLKIFSSESQEKAEIALKILNKDFFIYKTKDREFVVLIPKKPYEDVIGNEGNVSELEKIGLNHKILQKMRKQEPERLFKEVDPNLIEITQKDEVDLGKLSKGFKKQEHKMNVDLLGSIFSNSEIAKKTEKRVFLMGHGRYKETIAQLGYQDYEKFLRRLGEVNCVFLYVLSCYVGGMSQINAQKEIREKYGVLFKRFLPKFIVVAGGLTDTTAYALSTTNFKEFFRSLHDLLFETITSKQIKLARGGDVVAKERVQDWIKEKKWMSKDRFKKILVNVAGERLENTPSIYIPYVYNEHGFFDALTIDKKVKIITLPYLLQKELERFSSLLPITIDSDVKYMLIYPSIINIPITIRDAKIISIVSGNCHHYIGELKLKKVGIDESWGRKKTLEEITKKLPETFGIKSQEAKRAFFVGEIEAFGFGFDEKVSLHKVVAFSYRKSKEEFIQEFYFEYKGKYWFYKFLSTKKVNNKQVETKEKTKEEFQSAIYRILSSSAPGKKVREHSRRGIASEKIFEKTIIDKYIKEKDLEKKPITELPEKISKEDKEKLKGIKKAGDLLDKPLKAILTDQKDFLKTDKNIKKILEKNIRSLKEAVRLINVKAQISSVFFEENRVPLLVEVVNNLINFLKLFIEYKEFMRKKGKRGLEKEEYDYWARQAVEEAELSRRLSKIREIVKNNENARVIVDKIKDIESNFNLKNNINQLIDVKSFVLDIICSMLDVNAILSKLLKEKRILRYEKFIEELKKDKFLEKMNDKRKRIGELGDDIEKAFISMEKLEKIRKIVEKKSKGKLEEIEKTLEEKLKEIVSKDIEIAFLYALIKYIWRLSQATDFILKDSLEELCKLVKIVKKSKRLEIVKKKYKEYKEKLESEKKKGSLVMDKRYGKIKKLIDSYNKNINDITSRFCS